MAEYVSKAKVVEITATSRVAIKIRDNFYTVEYSEKRAIPDDADADMKAEREALFDDVNEVVDNQAEQIIKSFQK